MWEWTECVLYEIFLSYDQNLLNYICVKDPDISLEKCFFMISISFLIVNIQTDYDFSMSVQVF